MTRHIFKCESCKKYTMKEYCNCGGRALLATPLKYIPNDKVNNYRRKAKLDEYAKRGLI